MTLMVLLYGPIAWQIDNKLLLVSFLLFCWLLFSLQYVLGIGARPVGFKVNVEKVISLGFYLNLVVVFPSIYVYTGKLPWQISFDIGMQGEAYNDMQRHLAGGGITSPLKISQQIISLVVKPVIYAGIILGGKNFHDLSHRLKFYFLFSIFLQCVVSIARGTDKEVFDVFILAGASYFFFANDKRKLRKIVFLAVIGIFVGALFLERRLSRYEHEVPECFSYLEICIADAPEGYRGIADQNLFAASMVANYLTQGYVGLSHAMNLEYNFGYLVSHANSLRRLVEQLTGVSFYEGSYTARLYEYGWDDRYVWSSVYTWFANDFGFYLTPIVFSIFGFILSVAWRDAKYKGNDVAALVVCFVVLMVLYSPANYQLAISLEMYFSWVFFLTYWSVSRNFKKE